MAPRSRNIAMEFACCPAICDAIKARVDKRIFGYTMMFDDAYYKALKPHHCATMGIVLKNDQYKNRGIGTQAERLVVQYVFDDLDIPTLYADTIQTNSRSQHVLEKVGFTFIREDRDFKYYRIDRS